MNKLKTTIAATLLLASALMLTSTCSVSASETWIWGADISSKGTPVTSPVLESGKLYRIVASEIFWYNLGQHLEADAMYYTTATNSWDWSNHFPAPRGHSFLQINGADVYWGPFSNGGTGHTYFITYVGKGLPITFRIIDWIDRSYENNDCHLPVAIYLVQGNGLTPGYWKNHPSAWPPTGYSTGDRLQTVFGDDAPDVSLLQALQGGGGRGLDGAKQILARAATAALLNAATPGADYPMTPADIINIVSKQFTDGTRETMLYWATILDNYNNL